MKDKICVIINPTAGGGQGTEIANRLLDKGFELDGWSQLKFTRPEGRSTAEKIAGWAQEKGFKRIVAVGGDGTIQGIVNGFSLPDPSISLAIVPSGRVNNLADALFLPNSINEAIELALSGDELLAIDLGRVNEKLFISTFGIGIDARTNEVAFRITARLKKMFFWRPLYWTGLWELVFWVVGLSRELGRGVSCEQVILKADVQGKVSAALLTVNNVAKYAHRFWLTPEAELDDGLLDFCLVKGPMNRGKALAFLFRAMHGTHTELTRVSVHQIEKLIIECEKALIAQIDAEPIYPGPDNRFEISVFPRALNIVVPPRR